MGYQLGTLEMAIRDLDRAYGQEYPQASEFLARAQRLRGQLETPVWEEKSLAGGLENELAALRQEALLANPLLKSNCLMAVKRRPMPRKGGAPGLEIGMPSNHECNSSLARSGYVNELGVLSPIRREGEWRALYRPEDGGYVGEIDLHWDATRFLFTKSDPTNWKVYEMRTDGSGLRQVSSMPDDVDCFDACYLPNGKIVFGATASFQSVPCWHGQRRVSSLYLMNADGSGPRQLCFDQDHDFHPAVLPSGQIIYHRWDYTGINHIYLRQLMLMNPDGTGQRAVYGSSSWFPNALYFPRSISPAGQLIAILSGYHGVHRMGQLVALDITRGWHEEQGIVKRISGCGEPVRPLVRDNLVDHDWPKFLHPFPLDDKYFLVACQPTPQSSWGIYLADIFDNLILVREESGWALLEPVLMRAAPPPPIIPDRVDTARHDALVYLHDVYSGPGLQGVPRGTVKSLRLLAYHFGYPGLAGPDKIGYGGPWEVMRIMGTLPIEEDGSAIFRVPANTPLAIQPLDKEGKAVQLMRSWFTAMPGEVISCVGCHESPKDAPPPTLARAARRPPQDLIPWRGPARGFDFEREVQPVLDRYCVECHQGETAQGGENKDSPAKLASQWKAPPDLRSLAAHPGYEGRRVSQQEIDRMPAVMRRATAGRIKYTPAYDALIGYVRRVGIEDDVSLLTPGEYHVDTSPLVQMLRKGHHGVALEAEAWDRLVTWIDLNAPCHGTWGEVFPIPDGMHERRMALRRQCGGPVEDPERITNTECFTWSNQKSDSVKQQHSATHEADGASLPAGKSSERDGASDSPDDLQFGKPALQEAGARGETATVDSSFVIRHSSFAPKTIPLGPQVTLTLVPVPAGKFLMGNPAGEPDEQPVSRVIIARPFWMAECEISNAQFRQFDPGHDSRYYQKRYPPLTHGAPSYVGPDARGLSLNGDLQPVVRVSWEQARAFCRWLSDRTGLRFDLPTEAQWEWACRAGAASPLSFGNPDADFSPWANLADAAFSKGLGKDGKQVTGGLEHLVLEGAWLSEPRFHDAAVVTTNTGSYGPNAWGLYDMHGNAAEWTRTTYAPYPYVEQDNDGKVSPKGRKVVRGGSFFDNPSRSRSAFRLAYPSWQRVFNVGFRVILEEKSLVGASFSSEGRD